MSIENSPARGPIGGINPNDKLEQQSQRPLTPEEMAAALRNPQSTQAKALKRRVADTVFLREKFDSMVHQLQTELWKDRIIAFIEAQGTHKKAHNAERIHERLDKDPEARAVYDQEKQAYQEIGNKLKAFYESYDTLNVDLEWVRAEIERINHNAQQAYNESMISGIKEGLEQIVHHGPVAAAISTLFESADFIRDLTGSNKDDEDDEAFAERIVDTHLGNRLGIQNDLSILKQAKQCLLEKRSECSGKANQMVLDGVQDNAALSERYDRLIKNFHRLKQCRSEVATAYQKFEVKLSDPMSSRLAGVDQHVNTVDEIVRHMMNMSKQDLRNTPSQPSMK